LRHAFIDLHVLFNFTDPYGPHAAGTRPTGGRVGHASRQVGRVGWSGGRARGSGGSVRSNVRIGRSFGRFGAE
jgi:hypothetical protein